MAEQAQSFTKMAGAKAEGEAPVIGVGMLGYAFMGKAHSNGYKKLPYMMYPPVAIPRLVAIAGRNEEATAEALRRYGYERYYTDWHKLIEDQEIQLFDNGGPGNMHAEPTDRRSSSRQARVLREAASPQRRRGLRDVAGGGRRPASSTWWRTTIASCPPFAWRVT